MRGFSNQLSASILSACCCFLRHHPDEVNSPSRSSLACLFRVFPPCLQLAPSTIRCPTAAALGTSVLMHHLAEELSDLPTPPPARLRSRLLRWRSEDHGKERWKGIVDVLRVQSQVPTGVIWNCGSRVGRMLSAFGLCSREYFLRRVCRISSLSLDL